LAQFDPNNMTLGHDTWAKLEHDRTHLRRIFTTIVAAKGHADQFLAGVAAPQHDQAQLIDAVNCS
jgi:hypothetical protein